MSKTSDHSISDNMRALLEQRMASVLDAAEQADILLPKSVGFQQQLKRVLIGSNFAYEYFRSKPVVLLALQESGDLYQAYNPQELATRLHYKLEACESNDQLNKLLRRFRNYEMLRIIWRDINQLAELIEIMNDVSMLATACIRQATQYLQCQLEKELGVPCDAEGNSQKLQIIAMGKLGANELNLSSDVDLIFCYGEDDVVRGKSNLMNQQFFTLLAQKLTRSLHHVTAEGFVFRVDARLRPYGESGPLVSSYASMAEYYQNEARDWERYAMVKSRIIYGDDNANKRLRLLLSRFTYRIYLDFGAMQALRDLKDRIRRQVREKGMENNIKLGLGGIREIEFIAQVFQLIHGGHDYALQAPSMLHAMGVLGRREYVKEVPALLEAYTFLRTLEHRLQAMDNRQTHTLPDDVLVQARIASTLGFQTWDDLLGKLNAYRETINQQFEHVIEKREQKKLLDVAIPEEDIKNKQAAIEDTLKEWDARFAQQDLSDLAVQRLNRFLPYLKSAVTVYEKPDEVLHRVLRVVDSLLRHSAYLVLFEENPEALSVLVNLCSASPWITNQIARYPVLLAELLNERRLYLSADLEQLEALLAEQLSYVDRQNEDQLLDALRRFKRRQVLHIAAADVMDKLAVMEVSDLLTDIAVVVLRATLRIAWQEMLEQYGRPKRLDGSLCDLDFVIVAYGKLGGVELGYGSDLDVVFIHDADDQASTDIKVKGALKSAESISGGQFYLRLAKRLLHILSAQTSSGSLYSVDTRLKPGGASGLLVPNFEAFSNYQEDRAWTWEHQALVRARVVAGDDCLAEKFKVLREQILMRPRHSRKLRKEIVQMRRKMHKEAKSPKKQMFSLKQGRGGMTDIEFLAQYVVLAWADKVPELLIFTDNIRIFETCESARLLRRKEVDLLCQAYRQFRCVRHRLILQRLSDEVPREEFAIFRRGVEKMWRKLLK